MRRRSPAEEASPVIRRVSRLEQNARDQESRKHEKEIHAPSTRAGVGYDLARPASAKRISQRRYEVTHQDTEDRQTAHAIERGKMMARRLIRHHGTS